MAQLRGSTAPLEIEIGRYVGIPAEQRICKLCRGAVEDEVHFCIIYMYMSCTSPAMHQIPTGNGLHYTRFQRSMQWAETHTCCKQRPQSGEIPFNLFVAQNQLLSK